MKERKRELIGVDIGNPFFMEGRRVENFRFLQLTTLKKMWSFNPYEVSCEISLSRAFCMNENC